LLAITGEPQRLLDILNLAGRSSGMGNPKSWYHRILFFKKKEFVRRIKGQVCAIFGLDCAILGLFSTLLDFVKTPSNNLLSFK
jgi:hypothetical protein